MIDQAELIENRNRILADLVRRGEVVKVSRAEFEKIEREAEIEAAIDLLESEGFTVVR